MAENKKSFILYSDLIHTVSKLPNEKAGELFKHILEYVNDKDPQTEDLLLQISFEPIKQQLKRDLKDWESQKQQRSEAGKAGMKKRWGDKDSTDNTVITKDNTVINPITNITDNVTVNVNDTVSVTVNETKKNNIDERKLKFASTLEPFLKSYGKDLLNQFYKYWTEPNKSNTKFKQELEKTWSLERRLETWSRNDKNFKSGPEVVYTKPLPPPKKETREEIETRLLKEMENERNNKITTPGA